MKKTLTILSALFITLISFNAKAQDDATKDNLYTHSYLTFLGGVSTPVSDFGSYNYSNNKAGFAKRGAIFGFDAAVYIYKDFAIGGAFSFQDQGELSYNDALNLATGFNTDYNKDNTTVTTVDRYHFYTLMGGPQYSFTYKKFILDLRASAGAIKATSTPTVSAIFDGSTEGYNQLKSTAVAFAYGGSVGLRWSFSDNWDIGIKGNYIKSDGVAIVNTIAKGSVGRYVTKQPIDVIQTTFGITLHF